MQEFIRSILANIDFYRKDSHAPSIINFGTT